MAFVISILQKTLTLVLYVRLIANSNGYVLSWGTLFWVLVFPVPFCTPEISAGMQHRIVVELVSQRSGWSHWPSVTDLSAVGWLTVRQGQRGTVTGWSHGMRPSTWHESLVARHSIGQRCQEPFFQRLMWGCISFLKQLPWLTDGQKKVEMHVPWWRVKYWLQKNHDDKKFVGWKVFWWGFSVLASTNSAFR